MSNRKRLPASQRFGVWKAWKGCCFWCREPMLFPECHIDHVIPLAARTELPRIIEEYSLPPDFNIDGFENWVPAHQGCNRLKSDVLIDPSPAFAVHLSLVRMHARIAQLTSEKIESDARKAPLVAKLETALTHGEITREEIEALLEDLPRLIRRSFDPGTVLAMTHGMMFAPGWMVVETHGGAGILVIDASTWPDVNRPLT